MKISETNFKKRVAAAKKARREATVGCVTCVYGEQCEQFEPCRNCCYNTLDPESPDNWVKDTDRLKRGEEDGR